MSDTIFTITGSGCGPGAPSFFCDCAACREAAANPDAARTRSGAWLAAAGSNTLIDTPPDLRLQLIREKISSIDRIFMTHWHFDHFGGLGELEYYVKLVRQEPIELFLPPSAVERFENAFPDLDDIFAVTPWSFFTPQFVDGFSITPLPANHSVETAGFLITAAKARLAYFPDTAGLPEETARIVTGVDWLICDATFSGENWHPHSHMSIDEAIALGRKVNARNTVLTHMSAHYSQPVTTVALQEMLAAYPGVTAARDGMRLML